MRLQNTGKSTEKWTFSTADSPLRIRLCTCQRYDCVALDADGILDQKGWLVVSGFESKFMRTLRHRHLSWSHAISAAFALLCAIPGFAPCTNAAPSIPQSDPVLSMQVTSQFAIADFDGDKRPDVATIQAGAGSSRDTHYWIAFQLSGGSRQTLGITAPTGGLRITSRDVNGDSFLDVVVTTAWTNQPVAVLLNDGQGNFRTSKPSAFPGAFGTSEESWVSTADEIKDATAFFLSRYPTGNCVEGGRFSSPRNVTGLLAVWTSRGLRCRPVVSFLGRAPPCFFLHA
jgi:FG-GAP-like repeat